MKVAIMGGTFNPPHLGHLQLAEEVMVQGGYDKVLFIPSNRPAHKEVAWGVSSSVRLDMVRSAIQGWKGFELETCEILRGGVSYSVDTVECVYRNYDFFGKPGLVIGDDLFQGFNTWKDADLLAEKADLLVAHRLYENKLNFSYPHRYLDNKIIPLSSSEIRERIAGGRPWRALVPTGVYDIILRNGLYGISGVSE